MHSESPRRSRTSLNEASASERERKRARSVLIVDSGASARRLLHVLREAAITAWHATSVGAGIECISTRRPDVVVSELWLRGVSTQALTDEALRAHSDTSLIITTAYGSPASAFDFTRRGAHAYFTKPLSTEILVNEIMGPAERGTGFGDVSMSDLRRAMLDYVTEVREEAASLSDAARTLRLAPRSLRRMLSRRSPPPPGRCLSDLVGDTEKVPRTAPGSLHAAYSLGPSYE